MMMNITFNLMCIHYFDVLVRSHVVITLLKLVVLEKINNNDEMHKIWNTALKSCAETRAGVQC